MLINWVTDISKLKEIIDFFIKNVPIEYISHSCVQEGRALDFSTWNPELYDHLYSEYADYILYKPNSVLAVYENDILVGISLVEIVDTFAMLHDILIDVNFRGKSIGKEILKFIEDWFKSVGIKRVFLESGKHNELAHGFFNKNGFNQASIVMVKDL